jgi:hypothetical protein
MWGQLPRIPFYKGDVKKNTSPTIGRDLVIQPGVVMSASRRINIPTLLASTPYRANRLCQEKLDFPIQGSALSRSEFSQAGLEIRWNTYQ